MNSSRIRPWLPSLLVLLVGSLVSLGVAGVSASVGDMRLAVSLELGVLLVSAGLLVPPIMRATDHAAPAWALLTVLVLCSLVTAAVLSGSGPYWSARSDVYRGDYSSALDRLGLLRGDDGSLATSLPFGSSVPIQAWSRGILLASPAEVWFGVGRAYDFSRDFSNAAAAYGRALSAPDPLWPESKRVRVQAMLDAANAKAVSQ